MIGLCVMLALTQSPTPSLAALGQPHTFPVRAARVNYGRVHHDYPAADIFCAAGSAFVAPIAGVVDYVSDHDTWNPRVDSPASRGGIAVAIVGIDGWRYYGSHLQSIAPRIEVGAHVSEGQVLGLVGSTGNARGIASHLHFGISRPTFATDWRTRRGQIAPYEYLRVWQRWSAK